MSGRAGAATWLFEEPLVNLGVLRLCMCILGVSWYTIVHVYLGRMAASSDYYEQYGDENTATENIEMGNIYSDEYVKIFHIML